MQVLDCMPKIVALPLIKQANVTQYDRFLRFVTMLQECSFDCVMSKIFG